MAPLIGYYAHHHGSGHLTRARLLAEAYPGPVDIASSQAAGGVSVHLPPDTDGRTLVDETANGLLHWAPRHSDLLGPRAGALLEWVDAARPALVVVDVSAEVALLLRLVGVPVAIVRQHGDRRDQPHVLAYRLADFLLAPYPSWCEDPTVGSDLRAKTYYAGGFSRFDGRPRPAGTRDHEEVLVMAGTGGTRLDAPTIGRLARHSALRWTVIGIDGADRPNLRFLGRVGDPWPLLCRAGVVVTSAGHSALCEAAAADAPTVTITEDRPFDEQDHKVSLLADAGCVRPAPPLDEPVRWDRVLRATASGGSRWRDFVDGEGCSRAASQLAARATALDRTGAVERRAS